MDCFAYRDGTLFAEGLPVETIAGAIHTPVYIYSRATFLDHYHALGRAFQRLRPLICYSVKCCPNLHVCRLLREEGAGFDVVSGGELRRVLEAGADPARIVFAGVGKTAAEIGFGIDSGVGWFNVESEAEMEALVAIAGRRQTRVQAALRVNPDVDPRTHRHTTTGTRETKFGVDLQRARQVFATFASQPHAALRGIHLHLGSPVNRVDPYVEAISKGLALIDDLRQDGHNIEALDIGGGYGADYRADQAPTPLDYAEAIVPLIESTGLKTIMEPGRSIAANAGILVTRVLYLKRSGDRNFLVVDAGMTELLRPALYDAWHSIWPVRPATGLTLVDRSDHLATDGLIPMAVVGPVCETADCFASDRLLPPMKPGDLVAIFTAGAYGMAMSSQYNSRPRPPEVMVEGDTYRVIRRRETYDDLVVLERQ